MCIWSAPVSISGGWLPIAGVGSGVINKLASEHVPYYEVRYGTEHASAAQSGDKSASSGPNVLETFGW